MRPRIITGMQTHTRNPLTWLMLLVTLLACLAVQSLGLKTASGQIYGWQAASWESPLLQAAPRLGLRALVEESVSAPPVGANGGGKVAGSPAVSVLDDVATTIHPGQQGKHVPGDNNFIPGRSTLNTNIDPQQLLNGVHGGQYSVVGTGSRGQPVVDFGKPIGVDAATGLPTQYGTIHSGKNGAHIVPTNPTTIGGPK